MDNTQIQVAKQDKEMAYQTFGSNETIKLSVAIIRSMLVHPTRSGQLPTDAQCFRFMMLCRAKRLNPFEGDAFLIGYDTKDGAEFSLITAHQAFLKRAEVNPNYNGMESGVIARDRDGAIKDREGDWLDEDDTLLGAWATVFFKDSRKPMKKRCNFKTFAKDNSRWKADPAGMIVKCAEADALRSSFPTLLGGLYIAQEMARIESGVTIDAGSPTFDVAEAARQKLVDAGRQVREQKVIEQHATTSDESAEADAGLAPEPKASIYDNFAHDIMEPNSLTFDQINRWAIDQGSGGSDTFTRLEDVPKETMEKWQKNAKLIVKVIKGAK